MVEARAVLSNLRAAAMTASRIRVRLIVEVGVGLAAGQEFALALDRRQEAERGPHEVRARV
jgi:hypothetical protein